MSKIFLSHSSSDKPFVKRLAQDLSQRGHEVWLDEWEIKVGECIPTRIEQGLKTSEFVILVMSTRSTSSAWVEKEWKAKYWDEVSQRQVMLLPVLLENCEVPELLKTKSYADFRAEYEVGLMRLLATLEPSPAIHAPAAPNKDRAELVLDLLAAIQARDKPLSGVFVGILRHERQLDDRSLLEFARFEIAGYPATPGELLPGESAATELMHRRIEGYISKHAINPNFFGWSEGMAPALSYMRQDNDFKPFTVLYTEPIAQIEANLLNASSKKLLSMEIALSTLTGKPSSSMLNFYSAGDTFGDMYERIRVQAIKHLTRALTEKLAGS